MKDKTMCAIDIKPKTDVWTFWLQKPDTLKIDTTTNIPERRPSITGLVSHPHRDYIGKYV